VGRGVVVGVDVDTTAEKSYLAMLAARLKLPPELVAELNRQVETQTTRGPEFFGRGKQGLYGEKELSYK
jgi:hypothetical protein